MEIFCSLRPKAEEEAVADDDKSLQLVPLLVLAVAFSGIEIMLLLFCSAEASADAEAAAAAAADEDDDDDFLSSVMVELTIFCCEKH